MSKRVKQYLMLLAALGIVAVALGGGSGTFASFNAEVANNGNYFATGSLILNDNGGTNTCTSALGTGATSNSNSGTDCDTLFKLDQLTFPSAATTANITSATTTIALSSNVANGPIYPGDTLDIGSDTMTATAYAAAGASNISVDASSLASDTFPTGGTITDENATYLAHLTLTNAGTLDSGNVSFKASAGCTSTYVHGSGTLNGAITLPTSTSAILTNGLSAGDFQSGDPVIVTDGTNAETFIANGTSTATQIPVTNQDWNFAYANGSTVSGPRFNGGSAADFCSNLTLSIVKESSLNDNMTTASSCLYGEATNPVVTNSCDLENSPTLTANPTSFQALSGTSLTHGSSEYFLLAVHFKGTALDNTFQDTKTTPFGLTWHIDQA